MFRTSPTQVVTRSSRGVHPGPVRVGHSSGIAAPSSTRDVAFSCWLLSGSSRIVRTVQKIPATILTLADPVRSQSRRASQRPAKTRLPVTRPSLFSGSAATVALSCGIPNQRQSLTRRPHDVRTLSRAAFAGRYGSMHDPWSPHGALDGGGRTRLHAPVGPWSSTATTRRSTRSMLIRPRRGVGVMRVLLAAGGVRVVGHRY